MKIIKIVSLLIAICCLSACEIKDKTTNNIIYNQKVNVEDYTIKSLEDNLVIASNKAKQSVVAIVETKIASSSLGSGVIIKKFPIKNGVIVSDDTPGVIEYQYIMVTNEHVIDGILSRKYNIYLQETNLDIKAFNVKVIYQDKVNDVAFLSFISNLELIPATIADSNELKQGEICIAVGTPVSLKYYNTITQGIISHPNRSVEIDGVMGFYIQHDAAINPGNSGGGLFNLEGKLIGINTWKLVEKDEVITGIGFAIPSNKIMDLYNSNCGE